MDHSSFDRLAKTFAAGIPRRRALGFLAALAAGLGASAGPADPEESAAKRKGKGKGKKCGKGASLCLNRCITCGANETSYVGSLGSERRCYCDCEVGFKRHECRAGDICVPEPPGCCPEEKPCGRNCIPKTECCHDTEVQCPDGTCVKKPGCCTNFSPCLIAPEGCCHTFAGEVCTQFDGCCNVLLDRTSCDGKWCCDDATQKCCGKECCAKSDSCDEQGKCACPAEQVCGDLCCDPGATCCGGKTCCDRTAPVCVEGEQGHDPYCCYSGQSGCDGFCCDAGEFCCIRPNNLSECCLSGTTCMQPPSRACLSNP